MTLRHGPTFNEAAPAEVMDYLKSRRRRVYRLSPDNLHISNDGSELFLQVFNGGVAEYPVRETFLLKLLKWYGFPGRHVDRLNIDTVSSILNDFLVSIKSGQVTLKIENGEALSLMSDRYSEISDLDVIELVKPFGVEKISRDDFFMRVYTQIREKAKPVAGDECGFGFNILNSETGFRALSVHNFILRYICSNGAVIRMGRGSSERIHYGWPEGQLKMFLEKAISRQAGVWARVQTSIKESAGKVCHGEIEETKKRLSALVGMKRTNEAMNALSENASRYELANLVTSLARTLDIEKRLQAETLGGELLVGPGFHEEATIAANDSNR